MQQTSFEKNANRLNLHVQNAALTTGQKLATLLLNYTHLSSVIDRIPRWPSLRAPCSHSLGYPPSPSNMGNLKDVEFAR